MNFPSEVPLTLDRFFDEARTIYPQANDDMLEQLYPMVVSLRGLAADVSKIVLDDLVLSTTATREKPA